MIQLLNDRLEEVPGLHVIICTPKFLDYPRAYQPFADFETKNRFEVITALPSERVVAFHPIGFPGRSTAIENTSVIVDDLWAMIGSSSFRRRGLTFDGGSDMVFTDKQRVNGRSPAINTYRRNLLAKRLGIPEEETNDFGVMPNSSFVRLGNGLESFYLIREMLVAGGLGKIARLYNSPDPGTIEGLSFDAVNPDGMEFDDVYISATITSLFTGLNSY